MLPFQGNIRSFFWGKKGSISDVTLGHPQKTFPPEPRFTGGAKAGGIFFFGITSWKQKGLTSKVREVG